VFYTTSCKHSLVLLRMGEIIARNMLNWLKLLGKYDVEPPSSRFAEVPAVAETNPEGYEVNAMTNEGISTQREADISLVPASY